MTYVPETRWVGGQYPGILPSHVHRAVKVMPPHVGHKRRDIIAFMHNNGPACAVDAAFALEMSLDSVRHQLRIICTKTPSPLAKEERQHPNGKNKILYYTGAPL